MGKGEAIEQYETVRQTKSGKVISISATWSPIRDGGGRITGASKIVRDITEQKQIEAQRLELLEKEHALASEKALREREAELARVLRGLSLGELATSIAHEVNQPLAALVANAQAGVRWLSAAAPNLQEVRQSLDLVVRDGNRASAVVQRIRAFLRKDTALRQALEINDVVRDAVALANAELMKRQVVFTMELCSGLPQIDGDRIQLEQVIVNLIMNAADAMASSSRKELVLESRIYDSRQIVVAIHDCGLGMRAEDLEKMFEPFFSTKASGMGMGLSISRSIIEAHGGRIWAEGNDGPGLTVQFTLPAEDPAPNSPRGNRSV
jgi:two-component system, chemotaxis family, CheB/CheR fusion protein